MLIQRLVDPATVKVWSLVVTILGDLAMAPGACVSGPALRRITDHFGVGASALRVALHRLRKDGWITSQRVGRIAMYRLTDRARAASLAAAARIYAPASDGGVSVFLAVLPPDTTPETAADMLCIAPNTYLCANVPTDAQACCARLAQHSLPDWVRAALLPPVVLDHYADLHQALADLPAALPTDPGERLALRIAVLHQWRRIVLRHNALADRVMPGDWIGAACRVQVLTWLTHLPRPPEMAS